MFIRILFSEFYCLCANKQEQYFATFLILEKRDGLAGHEYVKMKE